MSGGGPHAAAFKAKASRVGRQPAPLLSVSSQKRHKADNTVNKKKTTGIAGRRLGARRAFPLFPALASICVGVLFSFHGQVNSRRLSLSAQTTPTPRGCCSAAAASLTSAPSRLSVLRSGAWQTVIWKQVAPSPPLIHRCQLATIRCGPDESRPCGDIRRYRARRPGGGGI